MRGKVLEFQTDRGVGVVEADTGERFPFHATRIADGSRRVPTGADVTFDVAAGLPGCWEAVAIRART